MKGKEIYIEKKHLHFFFPKQLKRLFFSLEY